MRLNTYLLITYLLFVGDSLCHAQTKTFIPINDVRITYEGRIKYTGSKEAELYWPGTSIKINFEGTGVDAILRDERSENFYVIIIDDDSVYKLNPDSTKKTYALVKNIAQGKHTVEIFKRTSWDKGTTWFYGFELTGETKLLPSSRRKKRKIEFYGNSICTGYALDDISGNDSGAGKYENNFLAYPTLTARHFQAENSCIAKSGIGVMVSWFPLTMPQMFNRLNPNDSTSKWKFSFYTPDIVVINLLQNDSWLIEKTDHPQFKATFGSVKPKKDFIVNAYCKFVKQLRSRYPQAHIICALGNMDVTKPGSPWPGYVETAVKNLDDPKIYTLIFPYKNTAGHPNAFEQKQIADQLITFIEKRIDW